MTVRTKTWPHRLRFITLLLIAVVLMTLLLSPGLRNKAGCLLMLAGFSSASCVVPQLYQLPDELAEAEAEAEALGY